MTTASGNRCRMISETNGRRHVSSVLLTEGEAFEHLGYEAAMHKLSGWVVTAGPETLVCRRGPITRVLTIQRSDAFSD